MQVDFMGLTGSSGVLPYHYTELVLRRLKLKDRSMTDFLDLFNHRLIALFFQALAKYRLPFEYERKRLGTASGAEGDTHTRILMSLIGLGTRGLSRRLCTPDESLLYYSGLFASKVRTAAGLRQIILHHFRIPVEIREFIGQWQELIDDVRTRLPGRTVPRGQNNQLGRSVMLGRKGWFSQGKIRIILGPLTTQQLSTFAPGTSTLKALNEIVRLYLNLRARLRIRDAYCARRHSRHGAPGPPTEIRYRAGGLVPAARIFLSEAGEGDRPSLWTLRLEPYDGSLTVLEGTVVDGG